GAGPAGALSAAIGAAVRLTRNATLAHNNANAPYANDHPHACSRFVSVGSISTGYASSPAIEPAFDSAKKRHGIAPPLEREYQLCSSGLVDDKRKYGRPTVAASNPKICSSGS